MAALNTSDRIFINNFSISPDGTSIDVNVETDPNYFITSCTFWTDATYGDPSAGIDLTSLLADRTGPQIFTISNEAAGVSNFLDGIFFASFTSNSPVVGICDGCTNPLAVASQLVSAKLCLIEKIIALDITLDCNQNNCVDKCDVIVLDKIIRAMTFAIELGIYNEAIDLLNSIRRLCTTCSECLNLDNYQPNSGLGFYTLNNTITLT